MLTVTAPSIAMHVSCTQESGAASHRATGRSQKIMATAQAASANRHDQAQISRPADQPGRDHGVAGQLARPRAETGHNGPAESSEHVEHEVPRHIVDGRRHQAPEITPACSRRRGSPQRRPFEPGPLDGRLVVVFAILAQQGRLTGTARARHRDACAIQPVDQARQLGGGIGRHTVGAVVDLAQARAADDRERLPKPAPARRVDVRPHMGQQLGPADRSHQLLARPTCDEPPRVDHPAEQVGGEPRAESQPRRPHRRGDGHGGHPQRQPRLQPRPGNQDS